MKKLAALLIGAGTVLALAAPVLAAPPEGAGPEANNWYVCKYVGTPGQSEVVQTGQNPIFVDQASIPGNEDGVAIGDAFSDAQGGSIVIAGPFAPNDRPDPEPGVDACPTTTPSPSPSPSPSESPSPTPSPTETPSPTPSPSESPSPSPTPSETPSPTTSPTPSPEPSEEPTPPPTAVSPPESPNDPRPPKTDSPSPKLAFTGWDDVVPLGGLALLMLAAGTYLLRRGRKLDS